jgi:hypothetical protein
VLLAILALALVVVIVLLARRGGSGVPPDERRRRLGSEVDDGREPPDAFESDIEGVEAFGDRHQGEPDGRNEPRRRDERVQHRHVRRYPDTSCRVASRAEPGQSRGQCDPHDDGAGGLDRAHPDSVR